MIHRKSIQTETVGPQAFRKSNGLHGNQSYSKSISSIQRGAIQWDEDGVLFKIEANDGLLRLIQTITPLGFKGALDVDYGVLWTKKLL